MKNKNTIYIILLALILILGFIYSASIRSKERQGMLIDAPVGLEKVKEGAVLIDVRTKPEYDQGHVSGALNIDWENQSEFQSKISEIPKGDTYVLYCRSGNRSSQAAEYMISNGFGNVFSIKGGVLEGELPLVVDSKSADAGQSMSLENKTENSLQAVMDRALTDEYNAKATYERVLEKYPGVKPFSNIINAEQKHIDSLLSLYTKYQLKAPSYQNNLPTYTGTISEACKTGVQAEIMNAKLYTDELIPAVSDYSDIVNVFSSLSAASQNNHLPAFERCS